MKLMGLEAKGVSLEWNPDCWRNEKCQQRNRLPRGLQLQVPFEPGNRLGGGDKRSRAACTWARMNLEPPEGQESAGVAGHGRVWLSYCWVRRFTLRSVGLLCPDPLPVTI